MQLANKQKKRCSTSYVIREMQIKTMRHYYTPIRMVKIRILMSSNADKNVEQKEFSPTSDENTK